MAATSEAESGGAAGPRRRLWLRILPIAVVLTVGVAAFLFARDLFGSDMLAENRGALVAWRDRNLALAALAFVAVYIAAVVFSIPGAIWISITGGFLFGTWLGTALNVLAATAGATLLFLIARSSLGAGLRERAAGWAARAAEGIERDQISYLLAMRLAPGMPFFIANLIPAFFRVRLVTFVWTTFAGIIPAAIIYTSFGAGIGDLIDRGATPDVSVFRDPKIVLPLVGLMLISIVPIVARRLRGRRD